MAAWSLEKGAKDPAWTGARRPATDTVPTARPGNGEGMCWTQVGSAGVSEERNRLREEERAQHQQ